MRPRPKATVPIELLLKTGYRKGWDAVALRELLLNTVVTGGEETKTQDAVAQLLQEALETEMEHSTTDMESRQSFLFSHRSLPFSSCVLEN